MKTTTCMTIRRDCWERMSSLCKEHPYLKIAEATAYAIDFFVDYYLQKGSVPKITGIKPSLHRLEEIGDTTDLPGMTPEVIQSHLVRFPKVTPEAYKGIIEELRARQNSEEGLKNPEAAAYGLCKRIQNGQPRTGSAPQEQHHAQPATVPEDNPFAIYEP